MIKESMDKFRFERRGGILRMSILIIICLSFLAFSLVIIHQNGVLNVVSAENWSGHLKFLRISNTSMKARLLKRNKKDANKIYFDTSIAFYNIVGNDQKFEPGTDLRGKFWEFQIENYTGVSDITYISNGPLQVNNKTFVVLTDDGVAKSDKQFCERTPNTWKHFLEHYPQHRWYFRGTHDTFVNFKRLLDLIKDLESKFDPMTEYAMAYNCHEYNYKLYPQGGTGYLFSNFAIKQFAQRESEFRHFCWGSADDVALASFLEIQQIPVERFMTNKFIVTWPNTDSDIILKKQYERVNECPKAYRLFSEATPMPPCPCRTAVSIHMHRMPMNIAYEVLQKTPYNFAVTFPDPNSPTFCKMQ